MFDIKTILCPTDFSDGAQFALQFAGDLASKYGATLHVIHVVQPLPVYSLEPGIGFPLPADFHADITDEARRALDALELPAGASVVRSVLEGHAANEIIVYARSHDCDLIVLGTHGRGRLAHMLMGSVAESLVRKAPCPVATIRAPAFSAVGAEHEAVPATA